MHWAAASRLPGRGGCAKRALAALERQRGAPLNRTPRHKHPHTQGTRAQPRPADPGHRRPDSDLPTCLKPQQLNPRARNLTFPSWARSSLGSGQDLLPLPPAETSQKTPPAVDWKMNSPKSRVLYFSPPPTCIQFSGTNAPPQAHHAGGEGRPACQSQGDPEIKKESSENKECLGPVQKSMRGQLRLSNCPKENT
ncbi:PREDICTED: uncharacterized protein LOC106724482 isoform X4 [Myotis brandtii]|uniref:uncharacterized protein LOC106724482 isoform X4 n=1 Tax=Myotis brandtii TaxID=109478 RepID=UPI00070443B5|nr:PREDICTED: uncharacterized protein LOC106724482 isoform X4 [Myotis brandtii]